MRWFSFGLFWFGIAVARLSEKMVWFSGWYSVLFVCAVRYTCSRAQLLVRILFLLFFAACGDLFQFFFAFSWYEPSSYVWTRNKIMNKWNEKSSTTSGFVNFRNDVWRCHWAELVGFHSLPPAATYIRSKNQLSIQDNVVNSNVAHARAFNCFLPVSISNMWKEWDKCLVLKLIVI